MDNKEDEFKDYKEENELQVVIGENADLNFSEVSDFVGALKPKVNKNKNSKIIIPTSKKKEQKK